MKVRFLSAARFAISPAISDTICAGEQRIRSTVIYPGEVNTPILDARPVPVAAERKEVILQPADVAAAVRFLVELNPRANVPELIIKPTVDDYA